ncbi:MAG: TaqI-like C-terminal specificity domain-containing protein [Methanoregula sp.]
MSCPDNPLPDKTEVSGSPHADIALLHDLTRWREQLARSIARNNLGMRSELITTAVNRIIFSLIFLLIAEDRGLINWGTLRNIQDSYCSDHALLPILRYTHALYHDDPYTSQAAPDNLGDLFLEDHVVTAILSTLTSEDRRYDLRAMPTEILSQVFSRYLTKTVRRSAAHHVAIINAHETTQSVGTPVPPLPVIEYMVISSLASVRENRSAREILPIRVIDPACGAGLPLLLSYRDILDNTRGGTPTFEECREILTGSIHGLDINRHSVAVTRMLLFFGLLEDHHTGLNPHAFFALSEQVFRDLRHTIQCGNALIGPEIINDESWMFCPSRERHALNTFSWHNSFPEIFATGGFDAIISNPPEGSLEDREWIQQYFQRHYQVYHPLADQSAYFIEKGLALLRPGGILGCIAGNQWLRGKAGSSLRSVLKEKQIEEIVDFSSMDKSKSGIALCILRISNRSPAHPFYATVADVPISKNPDDFIRAHRFPVDPVLLDDGGWTLTDTRVRDLLKKVNRHGVPLYDFVMGQVHTGVETGSDEGFVIDDQVRKNLVKKDPRNKKLIRRFVAGNDIHRYSADAGGRFIIFIPHGWTDTHPAALNNPWQWFRKRYPVLVRHLKKSLEHTVIHSARAHWWEIACDPDFWRGKNPKILFRHQFQKPVFAFDEGEAIADSTVCVIASSSLYLLGILNSRLLSFMFEKSVQLSSADLPLFSWENLKVLPIYTPDFDNPDDKAGHDRMVMLVTGMLDLHKHLSDARTDQERRIITQEIESFDRQIDSLVYGLYGLVVDEIEIIEKCVQK